MQTWTSHLFPERYGLLEGTTFGSYMSILFKPLGVLIALLRTEQKPAFELETTRQMLYFEFSVSCCRLCDLGQVTQCP